MERSVAPSERSESRGLKGNPAAEHFGNPVAVPDIFLGLKGPSSAIDRGHSLRSLLLPPAALPSLPLHALRLVGMTGFLGGGEM